ncbi:MAG TPA: cytochrome c-type biogenesis protein CcmH [Anaerolineales bacterium]|nr:cytochrome c-type biogenesis protein CcmH [Anaerolineales bacterium]
MTGTLPASGLRWGLLAAIVGIVAAAAVLSPAAAQAPTPSDDEVNAIAKGMYCPVCENVPLDVCPTQACAQWRETIREKLAAGWTADQIRQYFVDQYGARVLATPPPTGLNWLVYILPPAAILIAGYFVFRTAQSWRRSTSPEISAGPTSDDPYVARLEEELRRRS